LSNFDNGDCFITLTFANNIQDREFANKEFKKFIQRVNRYCKKINLEFKYITVIEYQKRGAIHYHMICNFPIGSFKGDDKQKERDFNLKLWKNGFVKIKNIKEVDNTGAYLIKYLVKEFKQNHKENKRRYLYSRNLNKPCNVPNDFTVDILQELEKHYPVFTSTYETYWQGVVNYREYNLVRE
jgi:hypothetical protein